jgi:hypothetical protein
MNSITLEGIASHVRRGMVRRGFSSFFAIAGTAATLLLAPGATAACDVYCQDFSDLTAADQTLSLPCDYCDEGPGAVTVATIDSDRDGLTDSDETLYGADPGNPDSDFDELPDGKEIWVHGTAPWSWDTDGDSVGDARELFETFTNPLAADSDSDGYSDSEELYRYFTDPNDYNSYPAAQGRRG